MRALPSGALGPSPGELVALDEDALAGALLRGLDDCVLQLPGDGGHPGRAAGIALDVALFLHIGQAVVEEGEHGRRDLLAEAIARAEILVDPDLHVPVSLPCRRRPTGHEDRSEASRGPSIWLRRLPHGNRRGGTDRRREGALELPAEPAGPRARVRRGDPDSR